MVGVAQPLVHLVQVPGGFVILPSNASNIDPRMDHKIDEKQTQMWKQKTTLKAVFNHRPAH